MSVSFKRVGHYLLLKKIRQMNGVAVYKATDTRGSYECLLHLLAPATPPTRTQIDQFLQGARQAAQLRHKNILAIKDFGEIDGYAFAASGPLNARPLILVVRQRKTLLSGAEVSSFIGQMASALEHAAANGCLHQALTPEVIWLSEAGHVEISGFGVLGAANATRTVTPYTAPEQLLDDDPAQSQADVYSLCAIAYCLLLNRPPFRVQEPALLREQILHESAAAPESIRPELPIQLCAVLKFGLAKVSWARYGSPAEFARVLHSAQQGLPDARFQSASRFAGPDGRAPAAPWFYWLRNLLIVGVLVAIMFLMGVLFIGQTVDGAWVMPTASSTRLPQKTNALPAGQRGSGRAIAADLRPTQAAAAPLPEVNLAVRETPTADPTPTAPLARPTATAIPTETALEAAPRSAPPVNRLVHTLIRNLGPSFDWSAWLAMQLDQPGGGQSAVSEPPSPTPLAATATASAATEEAQPTPVQTMRLKPAQAITLTTAISGEESSPAEADISKTAAASVSIHLPLVVTSIYVEGTINQKANLRAGPGLDFAILRMAPAGQRIVLVACNEDCTWFQLKGGEWIAAFLVSDVADPLNTLPASTVN